MLSLRHRLSALAAAVVLISVTLVPAASAATATTPTASASTASAPTGAALASSSKAAFLKAVSVRIRISSVYQGKPLSADLRVGQNSCQGAITTKTGGTMQIRRLGRTVYVQGDAAFWKSAGVTDYASVRGKWLRDSVTDRRLASLFRLCNLSWEANNVYRSGQRYSTTKGKVVDGRATIGLKVTGLRGTAYVAAKGTPYLLLVTNPTDTIHYQEWGAPIAVVAPPSADILN